MTVLELHLQSRTSGETGRLARKSWKLDVHPFRICFTALLFHWPGWLIGRAVATDVAVRFDLDECSLFCPRVLLEAVEVGARALTQGRPS